MSAVVRWVHISVLLALTPLWCQALHEGQSKAEVRAELGSPNGIRSREDGEIWVYSGDIALEFADDRLVHARGIDFLPAPEPEPLPQPSQPDPPPAAGPVQPPAPAPEPEPVPFDNLDREIDQFSNYKENPGLVLGEIGLDKPSASQSMLATILGWTIPVFLQFIFLLLAFKWVGAEALKLVLLLIAVVDRMVILGVQWIFHSLLEFPTTFQADMLASFLVMLGMVTTMTHAKQLPTAIKVVVASKVAGFIAAYLFLLFLLHNM